MTTPTPNPDDQAKIDAMRQAFEANKAGTFTYVDLKAHVQAKLLDLLGPLASEAKINTAFEDLLAAEKIVLARAERVRMLDQIKVDAIGLGPLEAILMDPDVTEVMVNGFKNIFIERKGKLEEVPSQFRDDEHLLSIIHRIAEPLGRRIDESHPMVDMRLEDGSRVNVVIPPISLVGPCLTIRKFYREPLTLEQLLQFGSLDERLADFLRACVQGRLNLIVSGGSGAGKTILLNLLAGMIANDERIIVMEDASELRLKQKHVIVLESRPPNIEGRGEVSIRDLVINALRMRPERLIVGETRGPEALDFLQALNSGHDGSMTSMHANNPRDALIRYETMVGMGSASLPLLAVREQMASGFNLIVHVERLMDGSRKIVRVSEVQGLLGDVVQLTDLFVFQQTGTEQRRVVGRHVATGKIPSFLHRLREAGITLPMEMFAPA
jgi:pilus assembly protein CpaF